MQLRAANGAKVVYGSQPAVDSHAAGRRGGRAAQSAVRTDQPTAFQRDDVLPNVSNVGDIPPSSEKTNYEFFSQGKYAWIRDVEEESKLIRTMKKAARLMIVGKTEKGNQTTDHYSMMGFTKAYNAAKKDCG